MAWMDPLTANLLDLLHELREHPVPLTIGGGFGLYLKRMRLDQTRERTLFSQLPMPRATNDLDLFVRADVLCNHAYHFIGWEKVFRTSARLWLDESRGLQ